MKKLTSITLLFISLLLWSGASAAIEKDKDELVSSLIELFKSNDRKAIAQKVRFPLARKKPLSPIRNQLEFIERYDEIFDSNLIEFIVSSNPMTDWSEMGWRGIMFKSGTMWLDIDGTIWSVNYESEIEKETRIKLINDQKNKLHPSLNQFEKPILEWQTDSSHIRIDDLGKYNYRYASWSIDKSTNEKPNLILTNGEIVFDGSGGNHYYVFKNGHYKYRCYVSVIGNSESPSGTIEVFKAGTLLLKKAVKPNKI
ncbi:hypothetical protein ABMY35_11710 [Pseudoalteromonas sp. BZB3]|uniref:hypothetical protein n=1 Tax=Pseudoalteromonas sp. BZB3 TaxID=3136670 RepID=UPI0032C4A474